MKIQQYYLGCLAHASYMILDERSRTAAVVDPQRDIGQYLADAAAAGCRIQHVFLTHFHADFLAGHIELRDRAGAKIYLGAKGRAEYEFVPLHDGDRVEFGDVRIEALETPGHTPEGVTLLVYDLAKDAAHPAAALTGDTLFIGDVGRPDLLASLGASADELADQLYDSLHQKLVRLPDETLVYPAHGAGSMCGKRLSTEKVSTIGAEKRSNYALQPMSREDFKTLVTAEQPEAPQYFAYDAVLNRQERANLDATLAKNLAPLSLEEVLRLENQGAQMVDVRDAVDFEASHLASAINIGLSGKYAIWCGTLLDRTHPIVLIAEPGQETEAVMRLGRIGFDQVAGYLKNGMAALAERPDLLRVIPRMTAEALSERQADRDPPWVLDVRSEAEWNKGHLAGSHNIPLNHLAERAREIPTNRTVVVHCESGYRSAIAVSVLARLGLRNVIDLVGGYKAWSAMQLPVIVETPVREAV